MTKKEDIIGYKKDKGFKGVVLEEMLFLLSKKYGFEIVKLPNKKWEPPAGFLQFQQPNRKLKAGKIAVDSSLDSEAENIIDIIIDGNADSLKKELPIEGNKIKPLYLFLDSEILLYARLKNLKFCEKKEKENRIKSFEDELEKKHPEAKRAVVNSLLELYMKQ